MTCNFIDFLVHSIVVGWLSGGDTSGLWDQAAAVLLTIEALWIWRSVRLALATGRQRVKELKKRYFADHVPTEPLATLTGVTTHHLATQRNETMRARERFDDGSLQAGGFEDDFLAGPTWGSEGRRRVLVTAEGLNPVVIPRGALVRRRSSSAG